jgi:hypothetical protein
VLLDTLNIQDRTLLTKFRIGQHELYDCHSSKRNTSQVCPLCNQCNETISHFLLVCPQLQSCRISHFSKFNINMMWWNSLNLPEQQRILLSGDYVHLNVCKLIKELQKKRKV